MLPTVFHQDGFVRWVFTQLKVVEMQARLEDNLSGGAGGLSSSLDILARSLMHSCGNRAPLTRVVWVDDAVVGLRVVATVPVEDGDGRGGRRAEKRSFNNGGDAESSFMSISLSSIKSKVDRA